MHRGVRLFALCLTASGVSASPIQCQSIRHVSLNTATGTIDRAYLPAGESFDFLIRAASELREFRGEYQAAVDSPVTTLQPWPRKDGTASRDATLRVGGLRPGATYHFTFVLIRRPTGNEGRLIESRLADALRDAFRANPDQPLETVAANAAPDVAKAFRSVLPRGVAVEGSPLGGTPDAVAAALRVRGLDVVHADYRRQLDVVRRLRIEFRAARDGLSEEPEFTGAFDVIAAALARHRNYAELTAPLDACRRLQDHDAFPGPGRIELDADQIALLASLKNYEAATTTCRGLLRDVRLPRYAALAITGTARVGDLFPPVAVRLEAIRGETERLLALTRKRDGAFGQVANDVRRGLDAGVSISDSISASFTTAGKLASRGSSIGVGLAGVHLPCSATGDCLRIVPDATVNFRLTGSIGAELGLTLARTETTGRTRHLFWFVSALTGVSVRLGDRSQRLGAGAVILRREEPGKTGGFRVGWYVGLTILDLRL